MESEKIKIIDFHTHVFPDAIANKAVSKLVESAMAVTYTDGTAKGLFESAYKAGISKCIVMPVLTSPKQFESITKFAYNLNCGEYSEILLSFAGMHPDCDNIEDKMRYLKDMGFVGIKIHPEFQQTDIDDERYLKIAQFCEKYGFILLTHAGYDASFPYNRHCTPKKIKNFLDKVQCSKIVLAHLGGLQNWLEVMDNICGKNVYLDTSHIFPYIDDKLFCEIIKCHGYDKILFATDSPWKEQSLYIEKIKSFGFLKETEKNIFYKNAEKLLKFKL